MIALAIVIVGALKQAPGSVIAALALGAGALVLSIVVLIRCQYIVTRLDELQQRLDEKPPVLRVPAQPVWFQAQGFYWEVLSGFFNQHHLYDPASAMTQATLHHIFQGPFCPNHERCKMLVGDDLLNGASICPRCGGSLKPGKEIKAEGPRHGAVSSTSYDPLWPLRRAAFQEAIAAVHEGTLKPS